MANGTEAAVDAQFQLLIQQGTELQGAFDSEQAIEPQHIAMIRNWMNQALDLIEPAAPPSDAEFNTLMGIRQAYSNTTSILPGNTSEHIRRIHAALIRAYEYFCAWCKCDFSQIEPTMRASACHRILDQTWRFSRNGLLQVLKGKEDGRTKRTALLHSYSRMYCWVHSMVKLGNNNSVETLIAEHTLALAACLRAILELFLDINLLQYDKVAKGPEKFFSFERVARHKIANTSLELDKEYKHLTNKQRIAYGDAAVGTKAEIDDCIVRSWGIIKNGKNKGKPNRPQHWTGMTVIDRVKNLGGACVRYYAYSYHYCNWSLHSGYAGPLMKTKENASLFCAFTYTYANEMFLRVIEMMMEEFAEFLDVAVLKEQLKKVELRGAHVLWDAAVKAGKTGVDKPAC